MRSLRAFRFLGPAAVAALLLTQGCTTGATPDCSGDAGCGPGFDGPPPDGQTADAATDAPMDVTPDATDAPTEGATDAPVDAPADVAPDAPTDGPVGEAGASCHKLVGTGPTLMCQWQQTKKGCGVEKPGSCPSAGLTGCCVVTKAGLSTATCYYAKDIPDAAVEHAACTAAGDTWVTTAP